MAGITTKSNILPFVFQPDGWKRIPPPRLLADVARVLLDLGITRLASIPVRSFANVLHSIALKIPQSSNFLAGAAFLGLRLFLHFTNTAPKTIPDEVIPCFMLVTLGTGPGDFFCLADVLP